MKSFLKFAAITFVEILIQSLLMGPSIVRLDKRFIRVSVPSSLSKSR